MRGLDFTYVVTAAVLVACITDSRTTCSTAADCSGSQEVIAAGRCAPEVACTRDGHCYAECLARHCGIDRENRFPQPQCQSGGICNQSVRDVDAKSGFFSCTRREIHCINVSDCPIQKPHVEGEWTCDAGICRFPNFEWDFE